MTPKKPKTKARPKPKIYDPKKTKGKRGRQGEGGGRPVYEPNDASRMLVKLAVAAGYKRDQISMLLKISEDTLRKHFEYELETGDLEANLQVVGALFTAATVDRKVAAQEFWLVNRAKWKRRYEQANADDTEESVEDGMADRIVADLIAKARAASPS